MLKDNLKDELIYGITKLEGILNNLNIHNQTGMLNIFNSHFTNSPIAKLIIDYDSGIIIDANNSACNFYGYSFDEITKMNINQINILPKDIIRKEMRFVKVGILNSFNFKHKLKDNKIVDVKVQSETIKVSERTFLYSIITNNSQ